MMMKHRHRADLMNRLYGVRIVVELTDHGQRQFGPPVLLAVSFWSLKRKNIARTRWSVSWV